MMVIPTRDTSALDISMARTTNNSASERAAASFVEYNSHPKAGVVGAQSPSAVAVDGPPAPLAGIGAAGGVPYA